MLVQQSIERDLRQALKPLWLTVENESHRHSVPPNSETHFKVVVVCDDFTGMRKVARHQCVYALLSEQLAGVVHALALHTYSPEEWAQRQSEAPDSPDCRGGSKPSS